MRTCGACTGGAIYGFEGVRLRPGAAHTIDKPMSAEILFTFPLFYCLLMILMRSSYKRNKVSTCRPGQDLWNHVLSNFCINKVPGIS